MAHKHTYIKNPKTTTHTLNQLAGVLLLVDDGYADDWIF